MSKVRSAFLTAATERGFIHQCTDLEALDARLAAGAVTAYVGYDCTADSLHIGHLMSIMLLRLFQQQGHKPIVLMGGGTTRIGDPTGRDETRQLLSDDEIARNSTTPIGSTNCATSRCCATSAGIFRSTAC